MLKKIRLQSGGNTSGALKHEQNMTIKQRHIITAPNSTKKMLWKSLVEKQGEKKKMDEKEK